MDRVSLSSGSVSPPASAPVHLAPPPLPASPAAPTRPDPRLFLAQELLVALEDLRGAWTGYGGSTPRRTPAGPPPLPPDREPVAAGGRLSLQGGQGVARPGASGPSGTIRDYEDLSSYMRLQREARQAVPLEGLAGGLEPVLFGPLARPA